MKQPTPITLIGQHVLLRPMQAADIPELCAVGLEPSLWELSLSVLQTPEDMAQYVHTALQAQEAGTALPFVYVDPKTGGIIGSTRFGNMEEANKGLEIGWTWLIPAYQRTGVNTEAKFLLLRHAFEELGCIRVALKTDVLNERSRNAMKRIGAQEEGILRNHMVTSTGRVRDSVMLSIIVQEWPEVKARLEQMMARNYGT
ncbi:GNAT family acetyltransferase [Rufibacter sp. DG15C]|uniref:GNAT family N-acetyltransferase n=1 Tax=Rufibacter sp. DG15C TaxID=1379909 RepID=UPI00078DCBB2|nr:GNAT family protein [Rufibacter sp. DG15C]AMM50424.1 GNAT family acetyltransferase [Rufibacter sp. DG15C]